MLHRDGMYVRVVGSLRSFQDKVNLSCFSVTPITDFNELTHHFLDAIYVHCYNTKGPLSSSGNDMKMDFTNSTSNLFGGLATGQNQNNHNSMDYSMMDSNFSPEQQAILDVLGTCMSDRGLKIDQIYDGLRGQMSMDQLRNVLTYLTSEGHVYSTVDENHFKRTA
jgi:replication factor A2